MSQTTKNRAKIAIKACQNAMLESASIPVLIQRIVEVMVEVGHYRFAWLGFVDSDDAKTLKPWAFAGHEDGYLKDLHINLTNPSLIAGPAAQAILTKKPGLCRDIQHDLDYMPWRKEALIRGYKSSIGLPLCYLDNDAIGIMSLYSADVDAFDEEDIALLIDMTASLTYGILMRQTQEGLNQTASQLDQSLTKMQRIITQTVSALAATVEIRDPYTAGHQKRVSQLAIAIGLKLGYSKDQIDELTVASNLHDIGKVTVPSEILSKPGKLKPYELELIKTHPSAGYDIIKDIEFPWPIAQIVHQHHERLDGSGYPLGLKGDDILMSARILAVADVMEAIVSHRPYRPGLGIEMALGEIKLHRSTKYDASVVDACVTLFETSSFHFESSSPF